MRSRQHSIIKRGVSTGTGTSSVASSTGGAGVSSSDNDSRSNIINNSSPEVGRRKTGPSTTTIRSGASPVPSADVASLSQPVDKDAFNARLDQRRKLRRQERLRRKQSLHRSLLGSGSGGGRGGGAYQTQFIIVLAAAFFFLILGWIVAFYWLTQLDGNSIHNTSGGGIGIASELVARSAVKGPMQLLRHTKERFESLVDWQKQIRAGPMLEMDGTNAGAAIVKTSIMSAIEVDSTEVVDMRVMNQELPFDNPDGGAWKQGWDVSPIELDPRRPLKIFVVPHSHCDPGWIKTFDEYFQSQTKQILTAVIQALRADPRRKFIWAEISYFEWWWKEQNADTRQAVNDLLKAGQFEFVTGGWVQPDEANTQLYAMEIQLQEGHDFIRETFGKEYIPKFGWSIDPFGYSPTMAYLLKKYNFEGMLIQRVHYAVKKQLALNKQLEFMWRQTWDEPDGKYDIFTHLMPFYSYDVPHTCGPDPSVCCQFDFARNQFSHAGTCPWKMQPKLINDNNVKERSLLLLDQYRKKANLYRSNVVLAPLGDDFRYRSLEEAELQYNNYQSIFDYINQSVEGVEIQFGTLSEYFKAVAASAAAQRKVKFPILKGSFFTYSDREEDYWSGYFTSRIFDKALDRQLERVIYAATSMGATKAELQGPRRALSLFQHHDGVTGTAKDHVVEDYAKRIHGAIRETQDWIVRNLVTSKSQSMATEMKLMPCWQSDAPRGLSQNLCHDDKSQTKNQVILYNPLDTDQSCGDVVVPGRKKALGTLPCEIPGRLPDSKVDIKFDESTGLMTHPVREEWMVWKVRRGGAYLFFPGTLTSYNELDLEVQEGGYIVSTKAWKRTVVERKVPASGSSGSAIVIDFVYETFLQNGNEEWFVRFTSEGLDNQGSFHTDLNGYNFDTHHFRSDMPIQSQVFPMPTHASIEDSNKRMTILSEHAQGTASLEKGAIDVWLDRRLMQDDDRGLGQRLTDNVPTRTRLRVLIEYDGYDSTSSEFQITPFCKQQWKELNHPLEMFGIEQGSSWSMSLSELELNNKVRFHRSKKAGRVAVPAVFMVYKRKDYLEQAIDALRRSDYPRDVLPIIISHDGHIQEMIDYVESIKSDFHVIQLFHPYACSEHTNTFPGNDPKLNEGYRGDSYGNPRDGKITCAKHHFTWMFNKVFRLEETKEADGFLFLEEDYLVAPTIYETIQNGFQYIDEPGKNRENQYFGLTFDATEGYAFRVPHLAKQGWIEKKFVTGPMAIRREMYERIRKNAKHYCTWDDYNWDWSFVHLMSKSINVLPFRVLVPGVQQVAHIGIEGGLHEENNEKKAELMQRHKDLTSFHRKVGGLWTKYQNKRSIQDKGFGGWGHPRDQEHCLDLFRPSEEGKKTAW